MPFLTELANWCREVTPDVVEWDGWRTRGRSGGVDYENGRPWCVMYHHTASSDQSLEDYHAEQSDNAPVCNLDIKSDGTVVVLAAGPTNTNGKGSGTRNTSKGTVPVDSMNSYALGIEFYNDGCGQSWPQVQIDVGFAVIANIQRHLGLAPTDLFSHEGYAPDRKVDPATNGAVQGPWQPRSKNSSGTWNDDDLRVENERRSFGAGPPVGGDDVHPELVTRGPNRYDVFATGGDGQLYQKWWNPTLMGRDEWSAWNPLGGQLVGPPTAAVTGERIDIMAEGTDGHIWQLVWDGRDWAPWLDLGRAP